MPSRVKEGQVRCIVPFLLRKDVFVVLPTGFGKLIIFQMKNYLTNFSVSECHVNFTSTVRNHCPDSTYQFPLLFSGFSLGMCYPLCYTESRPCHNSLILAGYAPLWMVFMTRNVFTKAPQHACTNSLSSL